MKQRFKFETEKVLHSILFILQNLGGRSDFHKIFKILYFADQKHLVTYGFPITGDVYIAMEYGPVPSQTYDNLKSVKKEKPESVYSSFLDIQNDQVIAKKQADMEELAESDVAFLSSSIKENKDLTFDQLTIKSHQYAWKKNYIGFYNPSEISVMDIADEVGIDQAMKDYISLNIENEQFLENHGELR